MKPIFALLAASALTLTACTETMSPRDRGTATGALAGAALGAAVGGDGNRAETAIAGAAVGAIAGTLIGAANEPNRCRYRDQYGREYIAAC